MKKNLQLGIRAAVRIPVEGMFADDVTSRTAMRQFTDKITSAGRCQWRSRDGSEREWNIRFVKIENPDHFSSVLVAHIKRLGVKSGFEIKMRAEDLIS